MRVGQEAHVQHEVGVPGNSVLVAEGDDRHGDARPRQLFGEGVPDAVPELLRRQTGGVDDDVGILLQRLHHHPFLADAFDDRVRRGQGVAPPG